MNTVAPPPLNLLVRWLTPLASWRLLPWLVFFLCIAVTVFVTLLHFLYDAKFGTARGNSMAGLLALLGICMSLALAVGARFLARTRTQALEMAESLRLSALVYQHSSQAMVVADARGLVVAVNPAFTRITGYTADEVLGKNPSIWGSGRHPKEFYQAMWQTLHEDNYWQGELWNRRKDGEVYSETLTMNVIRKEDGSVDRYVALFSDLTEKKRADELIWTQMNFDALTGCPNRSMLQDQLAAALNRCPPSGREFAFMLVNLDNFKGINDILGHIVGDALLVQAARRIGACIHESDVLARVDGDEFALIINVAHAAGRAEAVAQAVTQAMSECFAVGEETVYVSSSIGITFCPEEAHDTIGVFKNAGQAMLAAKSEGGNRFSYFTREMQEQGQVRLRLGNDLRGALAAGQFEVYYQPIVELATGAIYKAEALLRWHHPQRGMVSPALFIPLAEESGLISEIGDWVFRESAQWARRWGVLMGRNFQVSVNKSPVQFHADGAGQPWVDYLREHGIPGAAIAVEITEGLLLSSAKNVDLQLKQYAEAGIQVSIDDFGTGYSAMSYLKKFSIDYLKIDQSFVRDMAFDPSDRAIAETIILMAHRLGFKVIAEGIETEEQRSMLLAAGCDFGQGYLFSRPVPPRQLEALLGLVNGDGGGQELAGSDVDAAENASALCEGTTG